MSKPAGLAHLGADTFVFDPCVILRAEHVEIRAGARIDSFVKIEGGRGVVIGRNAHIASFCHINAGGGRVLFGDHAGCASHCVIAGGATDYRGLAITPQDGGTAKRYTTIIEQYALIFAGAIILPGVTVGEGAVVAAGAVVTRDVEPWTIAAGVPARKIGEREGVIRE